MAKAQLSGAVLVFSTFVAALGAASPFVDQQQSAMDTQAASFEIGGATGQELAQTVTAGVAGQLVEVRLPVSCPSGMLTLEVRGVADGAPDRRIFAAHSLSAVNSATDSRFHSITLAAAAPAFLAGDRFALVLSATEACAIAAGPAGDSYAGGEGFFRTGDSGSDGWLPLGARFDLPFQAVIAPDAQKVVVHFQSGSDREDEEKETGAFVRVSCFLRALAP
jgi:hypothetical protein